MENSETIYCRFCADSQPQNKLINLDKDVKTLLDVINKLKFLNASYINISNENSAPKTVCCDCYDSLDKAFNFLQKAKECQEFFLSLNLECSQSIVNRRQITFLPLYEEIKDNKSEIESELKVEIKVESDEEIFIQTNVTEDLNEVDNRTGYNDIELSTNKSKLKKPVTSWSEYKWICQYCNKDFKSMNLLRSHSKETHSKCYAFKCTCNALKEYNNFDFFMRHVAKRHKRRLSNQCYYCYLEIDKGSLADHIKTHFKSHTRCPACGEIFKNKTLLQNHLQQYGGEQKKRPPRPAGIPYTAEELTCELCNKVYKTLDSLREHVKKHTDRHRNYTCDRCGKSFYSKPNLTSHIMSHDQVKPFLCKICNRAFSKASNLKRHVQVHSGAKPFKCEQCGKMFRTKNQLLDHKIVHTDSMPYSCKYCNRKFKFRQILRNHERQHTGVKPYSCDNCHMMFTAWSNYNKHMKCRHGIDTSKRKFTSEGMFPVHPETGQVVNLQDEETERWKIKIMSATKS